MKDKASVNSTAFEVLLRTRILTKIRELKQIGTVGMGMANLHMVVRMGSDTYHLQGAPCGTNAQWQYANLFREVCESTPSIMRFVIARDL